MIRTTALISSSFFLLIAGQAGVTAEIDSDRLQTSCPGVVAWMTRTQRTPPSHITEHVSKPALRALLKRMETEDQDARKPAVNSSDGVRQDEESQVDLRHLAQLRKILASYGVPTPDMVGSDGIHAFWTLVQHATGDVKLQERVLRELEYGRFDVPPDEIAALVDKIRTNEHLPQIYGSQFHMADGRLVMNPIEDTENIDVRRAKIGLMPISDYKCMLQVLYGVPTK